MTEKLVETQLIVTAPVNMKEVPHTMIVEVAHANSIQKE